jgi:hypothetical protein
MGHRLQSRDQEGLGVHLLLEDFFLGACEAEAGEDIHLLE